jgi:putative transposase
VQHRRHTPEQVVRKLREADELLAEGADIATVARHLEVSEQTFHRWRNQYGGMKADDAKRLKELERENARLKGIVADEVLDIAMLKEVAKGTSEPGTPPPGGGDALGALQRLRASWCRAIGQSRSTQRRPAPVPGSEEEHLRSRLRALARAHPRYGYRRMTTILRREGYCVNHKRIQRLCRDEGLRVLKEAKKRSRVGAVGHRRHPSAGPPPGSCLGHRLPVRPDRQLQDPQTAQHHRRVHLGGSGHRSAPLHHRRRHRRRARKPGGRQGTGT